MPEGQFHLDPATYLAAVRAEVPVYDELQEAVGAATEGLAVRDALDLGCGTGATAAQVLRRHPEARLVGIDSSPEMARLAAQAVPGADVRVGRLEDPLPEGPFDLAVSALAVHHLPAEGKADLFVRLAAALRRPGRFVLADVVLTDRPEDQVTPLEPGVDLPDRLDDQLRWLEQAGFTATVVWTAGDLAVVAADLS